MLTAAFLTISGVILSIRTRFIQVRRFPASFFAALRPAAGAERGVSPFHAAMTSLAATLGTGNIAGVAGALLLGGPGAMFWMWVSAFFGMAVKYTEIRLALRFRHGTEAGTPMRMIERGLGPRAKPLAWVYAASCMLASFGMGNTAQINTVAEAARMLFPAAPAATVNLSAGLLVSTLLGFLMFGGARRTGKAAAWLVPVMSLLYLGFCGAVLVQNAARIPAALTAMVAGAFTPKAFTGGAVGIGVAAAFKTGIARAAFTHESGFGTAAMAHGAADCQDPERQALFGVFEVFFDTVVLCTVTALTILVSGVALPFGNASVNGALVVRALAVAMPEPLAAGGLSVMLLLFSFASMLAFALYGSIAVRYLFGARFVFAYRVLFLLCALLGACVPIAAVWRVSEFFNACMAVPNTFALLLLTAKRGRFHAGGSA